MAKKKNQDLYSNEVNITVETSANDTLTFSELNIGLNLFDKVALLISHIEWDMTLDDFETGMQAVGDRCMVALTASNQLANISPSQRAVIGFQRLCIADFGTAASAQIFSFPQVIDFTKNKGEGILVAPKPLYLAVDTDGYGDTVTVNFRIHFTVKPMGESEYFELLESRRFYE